MKKLSIYFSIITVAFVLISWGFTGHRTIGQIAWNHLTPQAKTAVQELLGNESLADAATWADQVRDDPKYGGTSSWHFINVPLGLSFEQFSSQVANSPKENVYTALLKEEKALTDPNISHDDQVAALKFVAHFVGDIHQPMHVSRAEDKGGNTIQVNFLGRGTNLHSLWDTGLLEHDEKDVNALASKYDHPTEAQISKWQRDQPMTWAWESYQVSSQLYTEIDALKSRAIGEEYYQSHIGIVRQRVEQAGIRLAGVLNELFKNAKPGQYSGTSAPKAQIAQPMEAVKTIKAEDAPQHIGETVKICAKVYDHRDMGSFVLVNLGGSYPNQQLTVLLRGDAKKASEHIDGQLLCVSGKLISYKSKPEIEVRDTSQLEQ